LQEVTRKDRCACGVIHRNQMGSFTLLKEYTYPKTGPTLYPLPFLKGTIMADFEGDTYSGVPYVSNVRFAFSRRCKDFFNKELDKRFSKNIVHVRVSRK
jgi:hypothetical protein